MSILRTKTVAKRRNVKKEKVARNRAYARQFQKKSGRGGYKAKGFASLDTPTAPWRGILAS